jgi:hypothetical protein
MRAMHCMLGASHMNSHPQNVFACEQDAHLEWQSVELSWRVRDTLHRDVSDDAAVARTNSASEAHRRGGQQPILSNPQQNIAKGGNFCFSNHSQSFAHLRGLILRHPAGRGAAAA